MSKKKNEEIEFVLEKMQVIYDEILDFRKSLSIQMEKIFYILTESVNKDFVIQELIKNKNNDH